LVATIGDDQGIPASASASVIPSIVSAKKRMAQRRHDCADESAAPYRQAAREAISDIADLVHDALDEVARLWRAPVRRVAVLARPHLRDAHESSNIGHSRVEPDPARSLTSSSPVVEGHMAPEATKYAPQRLTRNIG
jgi:hypothetical protein